ncbi:hypothetical protein ACOYW6_08060 [Parablastomonas sp. CN1-191]|uniref:hypothetical protein n=1 Tax=Parablastomonas sp. CN1-191 TaxID=3400908 RepID=UPI003BF863F1
MAEQKPPKSEGEITGFPYATLWEEFGAIWQTLGAREGVEGSYEKLLAECGSKGRDLPAGPSRHDIADLVEHTPAAPAKRDELIDKLYRIAAAYLIPTLKIQLGRGAADTQTRLNQISTSASKLAALLAEPEYDLEVLLDFVRLGSVNAEAGRLFNFRDLIAELEELSESARVSAREVPRMSRGSTTDLLRIRLMEAATAAIGDAFPGIEIEVKQSDTERRNPRPASVTGELLFRYLGLVDPKMRDRAKVRLFLEFSRSWVSVSPADIDRDLPSKEYLRRHTGRRKLVLESDLPSKSPKKII